MSKIAVISDIHANLAALEAVLSDIKRFNVKEIWCTGDIVGYYTNPSEVIQLIRKHCTVIVKGNHDHTIATGIIPEHFNYYAAVVTQWTVKVLTDDEKRFLYVLPSMKLIKKDDKRILLLHGGIEYPLDEYFKEDQDNINQYLEFMDLLKIDYLFLGHRHIPFQYTNGNKTIIVVGSVGQPRTKDNRASYALFDVDTGSVSFQYVKYNFEITMASIRKNKLPDFLATRLIKGV